MPDVTSGHYDGIIGNHGIRFDGNVRTDGDIFSNGSGFFNGGTRVNSRSGGGGIFSFYVPAEDTKGKGWVVKEEKALPVLRG
jgi:hypothetical protein